jgi:hypothetical protein
VTCIAGSPQSSWPWRGEHGFALGGNALLAHGVISRPTQDVDLFTDQKHGVQAAADAVEVALRRGLRTRAAG